MQSAISAIPTPEAQTLAMAVLFFLGGMAVPTKYGIERVEGFGRWVAVKFPYQSPPGQDEQQAMKRAVYGRGAVVEDGADQQADADAAPVESETGREAAQS
ncbi:hypothetical protein [Haloarcula pellucida]|uniref:Uncharacterized protein n=1 Tax=Haloarcula pellucida TaxID=1427151 RepID=A0A830GPT1_9EURY|nr:hypothetical protein [Halomicroarcula pellucida]GGN97621.1 hypothetical protein GCM10009030_27040 [Halomicroarcula pellucida]